VKILTHEVLSGMCYLNVKFLKITRGTPCWFSSSNLL